MAIFQSWNPRNRAWVKFEKTMAGTKMLNVKQKEPNKPFANVKIASTSIRKR